MELFCQVADPVKLDVPDADVTLFPRFFTSEESDELFRELIEETNWRQDFMTFYGKRVMLPRLTAWHGDKSYSYSGISMEAEAWRPVLLRIKERIEQVSEVLFNSVLLNLYRTGRDSVSWHQDDEPIFGDNPTIGSVSLGDTRRFQLRHKKRKDPKTVNLDLSHGSFLLMKGETQHYWKHQIPKTSKEVGPRINLTFRVG